MGSDSVISTPTFSSEISCKVSEDSRLKIVKSWPIKTKTITTITKHYGWTMAGQFCVFTTFLDEVGNCRILSPSPDVPRR